jgi:hypothetical protein
MGRVRTLLRILALMLIPIGIAAFYSVYRDEPGLDSAARRVVCGKDEARCKLRLAKLARTPFRRAFVYNGPDGPVQVDCRRSMGLIGDYSCARAPRPDF